MTQPSDDSGSGNHRRLGWAVVVTAIVCGAVVVALIVHSFGQEVKRLATDVAHLHNSSDEVQLDPSEFSAGACMALAPTAGSNGKTVFLDAGHGGRDPGGVGTNQAGQTVYESNVNLAIELDTAALLRARGYRVVVSRTGNTSVDKLSAADVDGNLLSVQGAHDDVVARDVCANLAQADVLVGIYMDAGGSPDNAGSVTLYDTDRPFSSSNQKLAGLLQSDVLSAMNAQGWQIPNDGSVPDGGFGSSVGDPTEGGLAAEAAAYNHLMLIGPGQAGYFNNPSQMPGAVIEPLYLTDPFEGTIADTPADQSVIAQGIADAIEAYLTPAKASASS
jgi:N-acetylmuramoyl-L-alanine amidase